MGLSVNDTQRTAPRAFTIVSTHQNNGSLGTAVTLTPPDNTVNAVLLQAITQNVRYTLDGTTPTASVGFSLRAGDPPVAIDLGAAMTIKVIQESSGAGIQYQWLRVP